MTSQASSDYQHRFSTAAIRNYQAQLGPISPPYGPPRDKRNPHAGPNRQLHDIEVARGVIVASSGALEEGIATKDETLIKQAWYILSDYLNGLRFPEQYWEAASWSIVDAIRLKKFFRSRPRREGFWRPQEEAPQQAPQPAPQHDHEQYKEEEPVPTRPVQVSKATQAQTQPIQSVVADVKTDVADQQMQEQTQEDMDVANTPYKIEHIFTQPVSYGNGKTMLVNLPNLKKKGRPINPKCEYQQSLTLRAIRANLLKLDSQHLDVEEVPGSRYVNVKFYRHWVKHILDE